MPLGMLASQHPGCYTPNSSGMGAILHNQAGDLHSPSLTWKMTPPSRPSAGLKTNSSLGQFDSQCIAPQHVQTIPDAQQPIYAPSDFTFQGWDHEKLDKFENDPIFDNFLFDPAPYPTVPPAAVANDWRPETIPREPGRSPGERSVWKYFVMQFTSLLICIQAPLSCSFANPDRYGQVRR